MTARGGERAMRVGLVSDTHGLVHPSLPAAFAGCDLVLHAGDLVRPAILPALEAVAPVRAVRGNNDHGPPLDALPEAAVVALGALTALVLHDLGPQGRPHARARPHLVRHRPDVVVHGHSHRPEASVHGGVLFVNPGSAGPRRFSLPRTAAILEVRGRSVAVAFLELGADAPAPFGTPLAVELAAR